MTVSISTEFLGIIRDACNDQKLSKRTAAEWVAELLADRSGALNPKTTEARRNAALDAAFDSALNSGYLRIYDSTQPTDADTALGAQVLLAQCTLNATAFASAATGSKAANAISDDTSADAGGTATWGTITTSGGTRYMDFSVGTSGANLNLNSVAISAGANVSVSAFTVTMAA